MIGIFSLMDPICIGKNYLDASSDSHSETDPLLDPIRRFLVQWQTADRKGKQCVRFFDGADVNRCKIGGLKGKRIFTNYF